MQADKQGRAYAKICDLTDGQTVWLDGGFTCRCPGPTKIFVSADEPCFRCDEGTHGLAGQDDGDGFAVGIYPADPGSMVWENQTGGAA